MVTRRARAGSIAIILPGPERRGGDHSTLAGFDGQLAQEALATFQPDDRFRSAHRATENVVRMRPAPKPVPCPRNPTEKDGAQGKAKEDALL